MDSREAFVLSCRGVKVPPLKDTVDLSKHL